MLHASFSLRVFPSGPHLCCDSNLYSFPLLEFLECLKSAKVSCVFPYNLLELWPHSWNTGRSRSSLRVMGLDRLQLWFSSAPFARTYGFARILVGVIFECHGADIVVFGEWMTEYTILLFVGHCASPGMKLGQGEMETGFPQSIAEKAVPRSRPQLLCLPL